MAMHEQEDMTMKLMIASDIHGSAHYCRLLLDAFHKEQGQKLLLLGDILYHGPRNDLPEGYSPKEVAALLNAEKEHILCVQGNCDSPVDQMVLEFPIMARYALIYLGSHTVFATHGDVFNLSALPPLSAGDILLHGHTHLPAWQPFGNHNIYMNPGSISLPKENTPSGYMIMTPEQCQWKTLDGTIYHTLDL